MNRIKRFFRDNLGYIIIGIMFVALFVLLGFIVWEKTVTTTMITSNCNNHVYIFEWENGYPKNIILHTRTNFDYESMAKSIKGVVISRSNDYEYYVEVAELFTVEEVVEDFVDYLENKTCNK